VRQRKTMKKIAYGFAAAALLAGTQFLVPANAMRRYRSAQRQHPRRCRPPTTNVYRWAGGMLSYPLAASVIYGCL
jgi:hypothetical protein